MQLSGARHSVLAVVRRPARSLAVMALSVAAVGMSSSLMAAEPGIDDTAPATELQTAARQDVAAVPALPAEVQQVLDLTNAARANGGLAPLTHHVQLSQAAAIHGVDQRNQPCAAGYLTHTGSDGSNAGQRIARTGLGVRNWAENIACGFRTADSVMAGWMDSKGHRDNIMNPALTHVGVSYTTSDSGSPYWVQVFAVPR